MTLVQCGIDSKLMKKENTFSSIDPKLNSLAKKLKATIYTKDIHSSSVGNDTLECRTIGWTEDKIGKAISISVFKYFPSNYSHTWRFTIVAWLEDGEPGSKPMYEEYLLKNVPFKNIEENIDSLLITAQEKLHKITREDLKYGK